MGGRTPQLDVHALDLRLACAVQEEGVSMKGRGRPLCDHASSSLSLVGNRIRDSRHVRRLGARPLGSSSASCGPLFIWKMVFRAGTLPEVACDTLALLLTLLLSVCDFRSAAAP